MSKRKLFLDFDGTICNTIDSVCKVYNDWYKFEPNFKKAESWKTNTWNFTDTCPLLEGKDENVEKIFSSPDFFKHLDFLNSNTYDVLRELCNKYEVIIVTIGTFKNISLKSLWIKERLPFIKECIFIVNDGCRMDKSSINMEGAIFLDDTADNLNSSNADIKICVGNKYPWNDKWDGIRCYNWTDIKTLLI